MFKRPDTEVYIAVGKTDVVIRYAGRPPQHVFAEVAVPLSVYFQLPQEAVPMHAYDQFGRPYSFDEPDTGRGFTI